jgi:hypothetical protein
VQPIDIATDGLERDDRPSAQDLVAQEVVILADIRTNIEDAVDVAVRGNPWRVFGCASGANVTCQHCSQKVDSLLTDGGL